MKLLGSISALLGDTDSKVERYLAAEKRLNELQVVKDFMAEQYTTISKAMADSSFEGKEDVKWDEPSYIHELALLSTTEKALKNELNVLTRNHRVKHRIHQIHRFRALKLLKSLYKAGKLDLALYNKAAAQKTEQGQVKYADTIVITNFNELLLLKRSIWEDNHKGAWVIPGGHVDEGEDYETAAKRELLEESGISVDKLINEDKNPSVTWRQVGVYADTNAYITYFCLNVGNKKNVEILLDEAESRDYQWIKTDEVSNYPMVFNMQANIMKVMGWEEKPQVKIIRKAVRAGLIPINKVPDIMKAIAQKTAEQNEVNQAVLEDIEKAQKNVNALKKIKKLVRRKDGTVFLQTFYVKAGQQEEEEVDIHPSFLAPEKEIEAGKQYHIETVKKDITGSLVDIVYNKYKDAWFLVTDVDGELIWSKFTAIKSIIPVETVNEHVLMEQTSSEELDEPYGKGVKVIKSLGGSTGAMLVEREGSLWVAKKGASAEHIQNEYIALCAYHRFGVPVPKFEFDPVKDVLFTKYIEGVPLSQNHSPEVLKEIRKHFVVDCLLGNWDVIGLNDDNIIIDKDGTPIRVDVGGSCQYRAMGAKKSESEWGSDVTEDLTMQDPQSNPSAAKIFKDITNEEIESQLDQILDISVLDISEVIYQRKKTLEKRYLEKPSNSIPLTEYPFDLYDYNQKILPKDIQDLYKKLNDFLKITQEDLDKMAGTKSFEYLVDPAVAKKKVDMGVNSIVASELRNLGLSDAEICAIRAYTNGAYTGINTLLAKLIKTELGNLSFKDGTIVTDDLEKGLEEESFSIKAEIDEYTSALIAAAKTLNHHHEQGNIDYNINTIATFDCVVKKTQVFMDSPDFKKLTVSEKKAFEWVASTANNIKSALFKVDIKIPKVSAPSYFKDLSKKKSVKHSDLAELSIGSDIESGTDRHCALVAAKAIIKGLTTLENSDSEKFRVISQSVRRLTLNPEEQLRFAKQHEFGNFAVHSRASSSSKGKILEAAWGGNTDMVIIGRPAAYVANFSAHSSEREILHKPFSLFYCGDKLQLGDRDTYILNRIL